MRWKLDANNPERHVQRGQIIMLLYEWDRVEANYTAAIELDPDYAALPITIAASCTIQCYSANWLWQTLNTS